MERAATWLERMRSAGLEPNEVTFNTMIKAHAADAEGAERWFERMRSAGFEHNLRSFTSMATAYSAAPAVDMNKVARLVDAMRAHQIEPDHDILASLLQCCAKATEPRPDLAVAWFREMLPPVTKRAAVLPKLEQALRAAVGEGNPEAELAIQWAERQCMTEPAPNEVDMEQEEEVDRRRDDFYKGQLYGVLVDLT